MGKRKPMKPMYRTAAEERLIEKALVWNDHIDWWIAPTGTNDLITAIRAVVRERKEDTRGND